MEKSLTEYRAEVPRVHLNCKSKTGSVARRKQIAANAVVCLSDAQVVNDWLAERRQEYNFIPVTEVPQRNLRERLHRLLVFSLLGLLGVAAVSFGLDYAVFRIRVATNRSAYGSVTVNHYDAVAQKNGKTQLIFDPPQAQPCVNALFPHAGDMPCWYLQRHPDQRTDI
jgi:hypothetical protein